MCHDYFSRTWEMIEPEPEVLFGIQFFHGSHLFHHLQSAIEPSLALEALARKRSTRDCISFRLFSKFFRVCS